MSHETVNSSRLDRLNFWLIRQAANQAPQSLSERLQEEWLADLETRGSSTSRLRFAVGCLWATRVIAREYQPAMAAASSTTAGSRLLSGGMQSGFGRFSTRSSTFLIVASLHLALFYIAFISLSHTHSANAQRDMEYRPVDKPPVTEHPPEVPRPQVHTASEFRLKMPEVLIPADPPADADWKSSETVPDGRGSDAGAVVPFPPSPSKRVSGGPAAGFPNTNDYYPSISKRIGEQGATTIRVCVSSSGQLNADPTIVTSSGIARLDEAAVRLAKAGSGHYRPDTENGQPQPSCFPFRIRFQITR